MHIDLGRRGDYAIRAALMLARRHGEGRVKSREIADAMDIPAPYVPHVLGALVRAGLVHSTAGPRGGYELALPPEEVSVLALVEAAEGNIRARICPLRGGPCYWEDACALHDDWAAAQDAFLDRLAATDLRSLSDRDATLEGQPAI